MKNNYELIALGQIILSEGDLLYSTSLQEAHFTTELSRRIFNAINAVVSRGGKPNLITVADADPMIPADELAKITDTASIANFKFYESKILEAYKSKGLRTLGLWLKDNAKDPVKALEYIEGELERLYLNGDNKDDSVISIADQIIPFMDVLEKRYNQGGEFPGFGTGFSTLDRYILGLQASRLYIIGGRPSAGKSALLLQIASHLAVDMGIPVGYFSLESSRSELMERLYANRGRIPSQSIATGRLQTRDFDRIQDISGKIYESKFFVHDIANQELPLVQSVARKMVRTGKIQVIFIDYLQLIQVPGAKDRREQVEKASLAMKQLSRDLNIPVVVAAQLRRDSESRAPNLADFQHSSQLEQDADVAMLLHDDKEGNKWLLIAKNRDGEKGRVKFSFTGQYLHFFEVDRKLEYLEKLPKRSVS